MIHRPPTYGAVGLDWDIRGRGQFEERAAMDIIRAVRSKSRSMPTFLITDRTLVNEFPLEMVKEIHAYVHLLADTPSFIANRVDFAIGQYYDQFLPPHFGAIVKFTESGAYSWDAPGTWAASPISSIPSASSFTASSPRTRCAPDIGISTSELGSWLDHIGPPAESERGPARIFGADWTFCVLGGTDVLPVVDRVLSAVCHPQSHLWQKCKIKA